MKNLICRNNAPSLAISVIPVALLLLSILGMIVFAGASVIQDYSYVILLGAAMVCMILSMVFTSRPKKTLLLGVKKSAKQILPAVLILFFIGTLSATWMLSGVVPSLIDYGLQILNPKAFLVIACAVCAVVSVVTGTSWTTIATIGVAFMGIGTVLGYNPAWIAGAVISGAYFGDKVSPLSDTTVLTAATTGVDLFTHIRYLMLTTVPAMTIALVVYAVVGYFTDTVDAENAMHIQEAIEKSFNTSLWVMVIPALTAVLIALRVNTTMVLLISSLLGLGGIYVFQPQIASQLAGGGDLWSHVKSCATILATSTQVVTGEESLDSLIGTSGIEGMLPTVYLVLSAMIFGGVMIGSGMLSTITHAITSRLHSPKHLVSTTVASGIFLNSCTGDQYLSIIIGSNVYKNCYKRVGVKPQLLGRTIEDSVSVTSVLIPWNSCGLTQSAVLGVATIAYLPFCIFNIMSPIMTLIIAWTGWKVRPATVPNRL